MKLTPLILTVVCCATASAQHSEDVILQQLLQNEGQRKNGVSVSQEGVNNEAYILQVTEGTTGAHTRQSGNANHISLVQAGDYVEVKIVQKGNNNLYEGDIEGSDAEIDILQTGSENSIMQSLWVNGAGISIIQQGDRNEVLHTGSSINSGIRVQQQGEGMRVMIETN